MKSIDQGGDDTSEDSLARFLDQTFVCSINHGNFDGCGYDMKDVEAFSQQINLTAGNSYGGRARTQSELVDVAICLLFYRVYRQTKWPPHLLCYGYWRGRGSQQAGGEMCAVTGITGLTSHYPNNNVTIMKGALWNNVLEMLGKDGEQVMLKMMVHCGIFTRVENGQGNLYQSCGIPMSDLNVLTPAERSTKTAQPQVKDKGRAPEFDVDTAEVPRSPASIHFVRYRMFYSRGALNIKGKVMFGLRRMHALNRFPDPRNTEHTLQLLHYVFPREFGLHNVFTSAVDRKETGQSFRDYTIRDGEIAQSNLSMPQKGRAGTSDTGPRPRTPKRLRGRVQKLVQKLQILHSRCPYHKLLEHYCPREPSSNPGKSLDHNVKSHVPSVSVSLYTSTVTASECHTAKDKQSFTDLATPHTSVSAFCRAVVAVLVPDDFWGVAEIGQENKRTLMRNVDRFIKLKKFDPMSLHEISQGIKVSLIESTCEDGRADALQLSAMQWLAPLHLSPHALMAQSDLRRRNEILLEFLYYIFDSILIQLIRSNFYVTESSAHQNHVFYFRHDVWRILTEPAISNIKLNLFQEMKTSKAKKLLDARSLGFGQIRLLPKTTGVRPITNLGQRMIRLQNGKLSLGSSINTAMRPVHDVLDFERKRRPALVGSALFSVGDIHPKLKNFASSLGKPPYSLYFAKADVKSCFDTIPQRELMKLMKTLIPGHEYRIAKHSEIKASKSIDRQGPTIAVLKPTRKFKRTANLASNFDTFDETVESSFACGKKNTIFIDGVMQQPQKTEELMDLLKEHVRRSIVKIGKKYFHQISGIPQGSIVSSLLCNFFYAQLEAEHFSFLKAEQSILLRLIDDFLLITTNKAHAIQFLQIMHDGVDKFGVSINPAKTLANFKTVINGHHVPQQVLGGSFPYCGNMINTATLEITKDRDRRKETVLANTLTVDLANVPGRNFSRKTLGAFKVQTHQMFFDTRFNTIGTVLSTIYQNFAETAMKCYRYIKSMRGANQPSADLVIGEHSWFMCCAANKNMN